MEWYSAKVHLASFHLELLYEMMLLRLFKYHLMLFILLVFYL